VSLGIAYLLSAGVKGQLCDSSPARRPWRPATAPLTSPRPREAVPDVPPSLPTGAGCIASVNLVTEAAAPRQSNVALWRQGHLERSARLSPSAGEQQV